MAAGLAGGYGTFFTFAGRYFLPADEDKVWLFVASAQGIEPGASIAFESPSGVKVTITRRTGEGPALLAGQPPVAENFLALSSVCPHLGCRVHWEAHNGRFFCPCHNGVFDPDGTAVSGPPAAAGQNLSQYPLRVVDGALYIEMSASSV